MRVSCAVSAPGSHCGKITLQRGGRGHCASPDRAANGRELSAVRTLQSIVRRFQSDQRSLDVAGQRELLAADHEDLLDLGQDALITTATQLEVESFQRQTLILRLGEPTFQRAETILKVVQRVARATCDLTTVAIVAIGLSQLANELLLQPMDLQARIDPQRHEQ